MRQTRHTVGFLAAIAISATWPCTSPAAPQQLTCVLNIAGGAASAQNEPLTVIFDDSAGTLQTQRGDRSYSFTDVSISNVAISGDVGALSIGIDRSSLGLVWQQYGSDNATIAYGQCRQSSASPAR